MTYYVFMNENIRTKASRKKPCMVVFDGRGFVTCRGVKFSEGSVKQSVRPCRAIKSHNVHAWIEIKRPDFLVKIGRQWASPDKLTFQ